MADDLTPETREQLRALCKKISVAHNLDAEIQEEIYGHMEDKLLAYRSGEEAVSEQDAFILMREHFGSPGAIKGLLQEVHKVEANVSLARRLAAAAVITLGSIVILQYSSAALLRVWTNAAAFGGVYLVSIADTLLGILCVWLLLWHWKRRLDSGSTPWFMKWRPVYFLALLCSSMLLIQMFQMEWLRPHAEESMLAVSRWAWASYAFWLFFAVSLGGPVAECLLWIWWCDRPPRSARAIGKAAAVWAAWRYIIMLAGSFGPFKPPLPVTPDTNPDFLALYFLGYVLLSVVWALAACMVYGIGRYASARFRLWSFSHQ